MSAISVAAWLLSAVAFAAINNGESYHETLTYRIYKYSLDSAFNREIRTQYTRFFA